MAGTVWEAGERGVECQVKLALDFVVAGRSLVGVQWGWGPKNFIY